MFLCFKQKTAYEMRSSDWSSDVCSSDLLVAHPRADVLERQHVFARAVAAGRGHLQPVAIQSQPRGVAIDAARIKQVQVVRHAVHRVLEARVAPAAAVEQRFEIAGQLAGGVLRRAHHLVDMEVLLEEISRSEARSGGNGGVRPWISRWCPSY